MNRDIGTFRGVTLLGELLLTYVGALFTYELVTFFRSGEFALGLSTVRFDPYLAVLAVFVVLVGRGAVAFRTHPDIRDHLASGTFEGHELTVIKSVTLVVGVDWYARSDAEGVMLLATVLFAATLAFSGIVSVLLLLRWAYLGTGDGREVR